MILSYRVLESRGVALKLPQPKQQRNQHLSAGCSTASTPLPRCVLVLTAGILRTLLHDTTKYTLHARSTAHAPPQHPHALVWYNRTPMLKVRIFRCARMHTRGPCALTAEDSSQDRLELSWMRALYLHLKSRALWNLQRTKNPTFVLPTTDRRAGPLATFSAPPTQQHGPRPFES